MKKMTALLLSVVLVLSLAACGSKTDNTPTQTMSNDTPTESSSTASSETESETGKVLVVYYSASGNTKRVAEDIAETAGGDLFELRLPNLIPPMT